MPTKLSPCHYDGTSQRCTGRMSFVRTERAIINNFEVIRRIGIYIYTYIWDALCTPMMCWELLDGWMDG